jgi:hypothetical protein
MKAPKKYILKLTVEDIAVLKAALLTAENRETDKRNVANAKRYSTVNDTINNQLPEHY